MTSDQKGVVDFYSTCSVVVFSAVVAYFAYIVGKNVFSLWLRKQKEVGDVSAANFRDLKDHLAYIPSVVRPQLTTPVICVDVNVPVSYIDLVSKSAWTQELSDPKVISNTCVVPEILNE